jgi:hypothetical protein
MVLNARRGEVDEANISKATYLDSAHRTHLQEFHAAQVRRYKTHVHCISVPMYQCTNVPASLARGHVQECSPSFLLPIIATD